MIRVQHILAIALATSLLTGCSTFKKFTGKTDNTVLPGERENILPPDQQVNAKPGQANDAPADAAADVPCDPATDVDCTPNVDQEASGDAQ